MNHFTKSVGLVAVSGVYLGLTSLVLAQLTRPTSPPTPAASNQPSSDPDQSFAGQGNATVLTRGPVHEGFAEMANPTAKAVPSVPMKPPEPINELPASIKPNNPQAVWLPGYWAQDPEQKNFLWVSGTWRVPPAGHRWVPGYWAEAGGAFQWVPGFWTALTTQDVTYLPAPPNSKDEGANMMDSPSPDALWVPGYWAFTNNNYAWQPGFWTRAVPGWMWIGSHYVSTPNGFVFVNGYWDYPLSVRGLLFAPVSFSGGFPQSVGFAYSPQYLIDLSLLSNNLFVAPAYQSYFFGDYYGSQYAGLGIYPWFSIGTAGYVYDPIFAYRNWFYSRENPKWRDGFRQRYDRLVKDGSARPPHTFRDQQALAQRGLSTNASNRIMVMPVREVLNGNRSGHYIVQVNDAQRREAQQLASEHHNLAQQRNKFEKSGGGKQQPATGTRSNAHPKFRLPRASSAPRSQTGTPGEAGATRPRAEKSNRNPGQATPARPETNRSGAGRQIRLKPVQPGVVPQKQSTAPPLQQRSLTPPPSPRPERRATNKAIPPRKPPVQKTEKEK